MSKQRIEKKLSGRYNNGDHDSFCDAVATKASVAVTKGIVFISPVIGNLYRKLLIPFYLYSPDFLAKEKESLVTKNEAGFEVGHEPSPILSDSNISVITLDTSADDSINNSSLSDTISIDSNTSAQIDSFLAVGDDDIENESVGRLGIIVGECVLCSFHQSCVLCLLLIILLVNR